MTTTTGLLVVLGLAVGAGLAGHAAKAEMIDELSMHGAGPVVPWRAHARSGEPAKISGYLGKGDAFDEAIADFSSAYADQSERDHEVLTKAVRAGRLEVFVEQD